MIPAAAALALFVWLLSLHPEASGRVYAAYGGVYVCTALLWLRFIDGVKLSHYDWAGALVALCGMLIIVAGWDAHRPFLLHGVGIGGASTPLCGKAFAFTFSVYSSFLSGEIV
ncbi:membrane protein [Klebsiella grimontii]|uniref:Membrane protein n=1 Tax=Klebsiella grimontii TaxID=2058152 RepID=A0A7H4P315_9ENTR|nr:membrane protein [Klebsiella grimontii]